MSEKKQTVQMPSTILLLGTLLFIATLASMLLPPGEFERQEKQTLGTSAEYTAYVVEEGDSLETLREQFGNRLSTRKPLHNSESVPIETLPAVGEEILLPLYDEKTKTVVVQGTYESVDSQTHSVGRWISTFVSRLFQAPLKGFEDKSDIIGFVLLIGGAFGIIMGTGAIDSGLHYTVNRFADSKASWVIIPITMIFFSLGGAVFGLSEEVIPFVMLTVPLAMRLGYDAITGLCMSFVAAGLGFAAAFLNPFTIGVAQGIAELEPFSGMQFRMVIWVLITSVGIVYTVRHAQKVKRNPELSPTFENRKEVLASLSNTDSEKKGTESISLPHLGVLGILLLTIIFVGWGVQKYAWWMSEISAVFVAGGVISGFVAGLRPSKVASAFMKGVVDLSSVAIIIAFSGGIVIVLSEGKVMDTILYALSSPIQDLSPVLGSCIMFVFQTVLNFFVPSGSGQAAMTMPLMAPLSDILGISRQTSVLAFQFGDGFGNMIIPTSAVTMSVLSIAKIPWKVWAKWLLPLELILMLTGFIILAIAVMTGF